MNSLSSELITLGADVGGKDAFNATNDDVLALRRLLRGVNQSSPIDIDAPAHRLLKEISLILRIDGAVQAWGQTGVSNVAINTKRSIATADIFVPAAVWKGEGPFSVRQFLVNQTKMAIRLVTEAARKHGFALNSKHLEYSIEKVAEKYRQEGSDR